MLVLSPHLFSVFRFFPGPNRDVGFLAQGYRLISVDIPRVWNHNEWIHAFEKFLDAIDVHHVRMANFDP